MDPLEQDVRRSLQDPRHGLLSAGDPVARIAAGMRRRRRNRAALAGGGTLAVALVAVVAGVSLLGGSGNSGLQVANPPSPTPTPTASSPAPVTPRPTATATPFRPGPGPGASLPATPTTAPPVTSSPAGTGPPVPAGFTATDLSFVSATRGWALGTAPCAAAPCTSLLRTVDGGRTWSGGPAPVAYLPSDSGVDCAASACVDRLRFADAAHGYAYGAGALFATSDGGQTWTRQDGPYVEQLEAAGGDVLRVVRTTGGCPPACSYTVQRAAVGSSSWQPLPAPPLTGDSSLLLRHGSDVFVLVFGNPAGGAGSAHPSIAVSHDRGASWSSVTDPCSPATGNDPSERDASGGSVGPDGRLVLLCTDRQGGTTGAVTTSTDGARSFGAVRPLPAGDAPAAVGTSVSRLVAEVISNAARQLLVSADGGQSWRTAATSRQADESGGLLGFTDARTGTWSPPGSRAVWRSTDGGATWTAFAFHR